MKPFGDLLGTISRKEVISLHNKLSGTDDYVECVLKTYSNMIYRIAFSQTKNKADADDIFQEVFIRLMRCRSKIVDEAHLKAWLIRATINCSKNILTSAWYRKTTVFEDNIAETMPEIREVYDIVMKLPPKYRIVVHLHYYEDMSISEISNAIGKNENTVKTQLKRAREILKQKLKGDFDNV